MITPLQCWSLRYISHPLTVSPKNFCICASVSVASWELNDVLSSILASSFLNYWIFSWRRPDNKVQGVRVGLRANPITAARNCDRCAGNHGRRADRQVELKLLNPSEKKKLFSWHRNSYLLLRHQNGFETYLKDNKNKKLFRIFSSIQGKKPNTYVVF